MSVRLGISPIGWSNDDLRELGGDIPLDTCLAEASEAGFEGIELGHKFPRDPALLQSLLGDHELHLVSGWYSGRLLERSVAEELVAIEPHRAVLAAMGSVVLVYAETSGGIAGDRTRPLSRRPSLPNGHWRDFGIHLTELADRLAERGIRLAYHHHMGTVVETADEIDRLMASTGGSVGLLLDTGHLAFAGADPVDIAWRHGLRISHVHCKDVRPDEPAALLFVEVEGEAHASINPTLADLAQSPYSPVFGQGICDLCQACGVGDRRKAVAFLSEDDARFARLAGNVLMTVQDHLVGKGGCPLILIVRWPQSRSRM
ncbi:MAG TPA: TIM barrel protein [Stellaceae bacterium]|nr:TIM barrel protein [Stellaceae bacterium]